MNKINKTRSLNIDDKTMQLIDIYREQHSLSKSAAIRSIINDFFLREGKT